MWVVAAVQWYEREQISQEKAAEIARLNCAKFIQALTRYQVSPRSHTEADTVREVNQDALARIRSRPRVNPTEFGMPDSTIFIRDDAIAECVISL
ncbi:MAG: hypothetical protein F6K42_04830 [Leptolyngbya sp. SIO1D8]|nr:hypothetical protein [Leptolyngbya sp. SIO1D8]